MGTDHNEITTATKCHSLKNLVRLLWNLDFVESNSNPLIKVFVDLKIQFPTLHVAQGI